MKQGSDVQRRRPRVGRVRQTLDFDRIANDLHASVISDTLDAFGHLNHALPPRIRPIDPGSTVVGRAATLHLVEEFSEPASPYKGLIAAMDRVPRDSVIIVAAGTTRCAIWGELFSIAAQARGARGTVVDGYVRDTAKVIAMGFPLFAVGTSPLDSKGRATLLAEQIELEIDGIRIAPGDLIFGDHDGVVVVPAELEAEVITRAYEKIRNEAAARTALLSGSFMRKVWDEHRVL